MIGLLKEGQRIDPSQVTYIILILFSGARALPVCRNHWVESFSTYFIFLLNLQQRDGI